MDNSLLKHLFPARLLPRWAILFLDLAMVGGAVLLAYLFRYDFSLDFTEFRTLKHTVVLALLANWFAACSVSRCWVGMSPRSPSC